MKSLICTVIIAFCIGICSTLGDVKVDETELTGVWSSRSIESNMDDFTNNVKSVLFIVYENLNYNNMTTNFVEIRAELILVMNNGKKKLVADSYPVLLKKKMIWFGPTFDHLEFKVELHNRKLVFDGKKTKIVFEKDSTIPGNELRQKGRVIEAKPKGSVDKSDGSGRNGR